MIAQPTLKAEEWPELRRAKASANSGWTYFANLVKTLHRELGEERTCQVLKALMADNARRFVLPGMKGFGLQGRDPWALASYFKLATGEVLGYKVMLVKESPRRVLYQVHPPCLWFPDLDIPASFCRAMGEFEREACRLVNPKISVTVNKLMTAGDPYCELAFQQEG